MDMLGCVGVDVGGTNTDAVVVCQRRVVAAVKQPTTRDVITGVRKALWELLSRVKLTDPGLRVVQVNIGTTHFVNAVVQRTSLVKVSVIRLCGQASKALPPFGDFPRDLESVIRGEVYMINGGFEFNGKEISAVVEDEVRACARSSLNKGVRNFVVAGVFSPVNTRQEEKVRDLLTSEFPDVSVTISSDVGQLGLVERENAAILNESLKPLCQKTVRGFRTALDELGLSCPFYLTQNDGTIINSKEASRFPVTTFASGPTNSMRGAAFLLDVEDCIVVDIGGTTTDVGALVRGFPRQASAHVKVGGVQTNFRMPDVLSVGLGGGSIVNISGTGGNNNISVGPLSTGYRLTEEGLAFGGDTFTTTDAAILIGLIELGDKERVKGRVSFKDAEAAIAKIRDIVEDSVDQMKTSNADVTVALVGGGSVLIDKDNTRLKGVSDLIVPRHFGVANAIGAALSQISGAVDYVASLTDLIGEQRFQSEVKAAENGAGSGDMETAVERAKSRLFSEAKKCLREEAVGKAKKIAVDFGANPASLEVVEVSDISLAYIPGNACRVKVKVVGDLASEVLVESATPLGSLDLHSTDVPEPQGEMDVPGNMQTSSTGRPLGSQSGPALTSVDPLTYTPDVNPSSGEWTISEYDVECICIGAGILGCGGGGSPYLGRIMTQRKLREGKTIRVISTESYAADADAEEEIAVAVAFMGAPVVLSEKIEGGQETRIALDALGVLLNVADSDQFLESKGCKVTRNDRRITCDYLPTDLSSPLGPNEGKRKRITAIYSMEIGGMNSVKSLLLAADIGLPVLDCDEIGRAFPELQMTTHSIYKGLSYPAVTADEKGRRAAVLYAESHKDVEDYFRDVCTDMGCECALVMSVLGPQQVGRMTVKGSLSRTWRLGRAVLLSQAANTCPLAAILGLENGQVIITGKITEVDRETRGGFTRGEMRIEGLGADSGRSARIDFQNENLVARDLGPPEVILACTPDLITCVETETGHAITTEEVRYGLRVSVIVLPSCPEMNTPEALRVVGPSAFGYDDIPYTPVGKYVQPESVPLCHAL